MRTMSSRTPRRPGAAGFLALGLAAAGLLAAPDPAGAQLAQKRTITIEGARRAIAAAASEAARLRAGGVIAVVDDGGNLVALERLDGTFAAGANVSIGKARTAVLFKRPTKFFEEIIRNGRTPMVALSDFTPLQGGVPIVVDGEVVGGIGVSGASSAPQDEELAAVGAAAVEGTGAAEATTGTGSAGTNGSDGRAGAPAEARHWDHATVAAAFAKGAVLYGGEGRNYMVHASRRDRAGAAEVHALDTDIIYVLDGAATLVTGGSLVDGAAVEPNEIRGPRIEGGEPRRLRKGDVVIVPNGTPHWFAEVRRPLTYYVVKVR